MRIGILTASHTDNNGTDIQAYAMQELLLSVIHENDSIEIINYRCRGLEKSNFLMEELSVSEFFHLPQKILNHLLHKRFRKKFLNITEQVYARSNVKELSYDAIVVGSDQLWNLDLTNGDMGYFLDFETKAIKYSYAVSFGHNDIEKLDSRYGMIRHLKDFVSVSVREISSKKKLNEINIVCRHDLDPVLMLSEKSRKRIEIYSVEEKPFVLLYFVKLNYDAINWAKKFAKLNDYEVILISDSIKKIQGVKCISCISLERWAGYVSKAKLMLTNSYHGLTYAISCKTDFYYVDLNTKLQENNRMLDLLEITGLYERVWRMDAPIFCSPIAWNDVYSAISFYRKKSLTYLSEIVQTEEVEE